MLKNTKTVVGGAILAFGFLGNGVCGVGAYFQVIDQFGGPRFMATDGTLPEYDDARSPDEKLWGQMLLAVSVGKSQSLLNGFGVNMLQKWKEGNAVCSRKSNHSEMVT
jgi:hypothetical protein